jgi:hypothetical protein
LVRLAEFGTVINDLEEIWNMSAFDVGGGATTVTPRAIAALAGADGGAVLIDGLGGGVLLDAPDGGASGLKVQLETTTNADDDFAPLDDGKPLELSSPAVHAAFDGLVRVENPTVTTVNTIDCARCHAATPTELLVAEPIFSLDDRTSALAFQPKGAIVSQAQMAPTFINPDDGQFNIHAFSYFGASPGISQRTVNETAFVVDYLNAIPSE